MRFAGVRRNPFARNEVRSSIYFLHQTRPSSSTVAVSCGLTCSRIRRTNITVQELSLPTELVITAIKPSYCTSFITHIIMVELQLGEAVAWCKAPNRALFEVPSCTKSCCFHLFSAFLRAPNRALFCVSSCAKSCSFPRLLVHQIVLFFCACSCAKPCFIGIFCLLYI